MYISESFHLNKACKENSLMYGEERKKEVLHIVTHVTVEYRCLFDILHVLSVFKVDDFSF